MKKTILIVMSIFLLLGAVSASEDIASDANDSTIAAEAPQDTISSSDAQPVLKEDETPTVTSSNVNGKAGNTITLKTTVKNSQGPVKGKSVTFTLNGQTYTAKTDSSGVASVNVKCPSTSVLKTTSKTKGKTMTKTTTYSKTYSASASVDGATTSFDVTSTKNPVVVKYKIIKKTKTHTFKVKTGQKVYKKGSYAFGTVFVKSSKLNYLAVMGADKNGYIKFMVKDHVKKNGKWKWDSWFKVKKGKFYEYTYPPTLKVDKVMVKYTHVSYKKIR